MKVFDRSQAGYVWTRPGGLVIAKILASTGLDHIRCPHIYWEGGLHVSSLASVLICIPNI